jgi:hypothetical protein
MLRAGVPLRLHKLTTRSIGHNPVARQRQPDIPERCREDDMMNHLWDPMIDIGEFRATTPPPSSCCRRGRTHDD